LLIFDGFRRKFIDIEAGTGQNNRSNSFQAVAFRKTGTCYQYLQSSQPSGYTAHTNDTKVYRY